MDHVTFALECDGDVAEELSEALVNRAQANVQSATKSNLDGSGETVLQLVQIAVAAAGALLPVLTHWTDKKKIRKIRLGDLEIENPTPEQATELWRQYLAASRPDG